MQLTKRSPEEIEYAFETFVEGVQTIINEHFAKNYAMLTPPTVAVHPGRTYWKVVKEEKQGWGLSCSVYGFVRKSDGAIFKAATYKAPYTKGNSAIRGYVNDGANGLKSVTPYGVVYAR
tara:strand:+ start:3185 stop:3541 length:357 start_codon:yes stop_codon:yes gene_type:complete